MAPSLGRICAVAILVAWLGGACAAAGAEPPVALRLATTTSTYDSGLLDRLLPAFEERYNVRVQVIAVGTGQALALGRRGDVDVVLVHNAPLETEFVAGGYGVERVLVMVNDFVFVGPHLDPAGLSGAGSAADAMRRVHASASPFISRADESGTHAKELLLWEAAGLRPDKTDDWYLEIGQGMAETLQFAEERRAYTLSDRGTYLGLAERLPDLGIVFGGATLAENPDPSLRNPYAVIQVRAADPHGPSARAAAAFVAWLVSPATQERIGEFGVGTPPQPLFYPASAEWCSRQGREAPGCEGG